MHLWTARVKELAKADNQSMFAKVITKRPHGRLLTQYMYTTTKCRVQVF